MKRSENKLDTMSPNEINRRDLIKRSSAAGLAVSLPLGLLPQELMASTPKRGGIFRAAVKGGSTTDSLDGAMLLDTHNIKTSWACRNNLTEIAADGSLVGELAESWEASADAKTWVFNIRKDVEFHNGKTLDAEDVIFSINHHRGEDSTSGAAGLLKGITKLQADGKNRVVFSLSGGNADFPFLLADFHLVIVPAGTSAEGWESGIGTGPYTLAEWQPGVQSRGNRNPNYFKEGKPYFDEFLLLNVTDSVARQSALISGTVDAIDSPDLNTMQQLMKVPSIEIKETAGFTHYVYPMDTRVEPFNNNDVRLALKYGIDREAFVRKILGGYGYVGNDHPISSGMRFFASDLPQREYDPDKAKFHLKKAGLDSLTVQMKAADIFPGAKDGALLYQSSAANAGINIDVMAVPEDGYWSNVWLKEPFIASYWGGRPTADWMFSTAYESSAAWNESHWNNAKFDQLLVAARAELDEVKRSQMYHDLQSICRDDGGTIVAGFSNSILAIGNGVQTPDTIGGNWPMDGDKSLERWWFA